LTTTLNASNSGSGGLVATADASGVLALQTAGVTAVTVDTSQNVGIGTTSPTAKLVVSGGGAAVQGNGYPSTGAGWEFYTDTTTGSWAQSFSRTGGVWLDANWNALTHKFSISGTERMRIDSSGKVTVGSVAQTKGNFCLYGPSGTQTNMYLTRSGGVEGYIGFNSSDTNFYFGSGGSFTANGVYLANSVNSWSSVSDERLKENLVPIANAMAKVSSLRAVTGNFISDTAKTSRSFLIAQDVQKVLPEAISTTIRDEIEYLGVAYTDTIPLLVAAIKEQQALITSLTARIAALEGTPA
jgi:hypothetical protein